MNKWIIAFFLIVISSVCFAADENDGSCSGWADALPCNLKIISWVEVNFEGDLLKEHKSSFEKLIRLRLRNDLSMYSHEVTEFGGLVKEKGTDMEKQEFKERGQLSCLAWTVGNDYPVAFLVECQLTGWGLYTNSSYNEFENRILGYGSSQNVKVRIPAQCEHPYWLNVNTDSGRT